MFLSLLLAACCGLAWGNLPSGQDAASAHARTVQAAKHVVSDTGSHQSALKDSVAKLIRFRNGVSGEKSNRFSLQSKQSESPREATKFVSRRSDEESNCTDFSEAILPVITASYSGNCSLEKAEEISGWLAWDIFLLADPAYSHLPPKKPVDMTWNDVIGPFCLASSTCGTEGFYARSKEIARRYVGKITESCTWHTETQVAETPLEILTSILHVYYLCLEKSGDFCFPSYYTALSSFISVDTAEDPVDFMESFIPNFCSECTVVVFQQQASDAGKDDAESTLMSNLICSQVLGEWCYLDLIKLENATEAEMVPIWCDGVCMPLVARTWAEIDRLQGTETVSQTQSFQATYCFNLDNQMVGDRNKKCLEVMDMNFTAATAPLYDDLVKHCGAPPLGASTNPYDIVQWPDDKSSSCSDACDDAMHAWLDQWECCAYSYVYGAESFMPEGSTFVEWFTNPVKSCAGGSAAMRTSSMCDEEGAWEVEATLELQNMPFWYMVYYFSAIRNQMCYDISLATGLSYWDCNVKDPMELSNGGVSVVVTWETHSALQKIMIIDILQLYFDYYKTRRRSATLTSPDILMWSISRQDPFESRIDPYTLVYANVASVSSSELPFLPGWGNRVFNQSACSETRRWPELTASLKGQSAFTGGLGRMLERGVYEAWICFKSHPCTDSLLDQAPTTLTKGIQLPTSASDLMCYVYDEEAKLFQPWGFNSQLRLVSERTLNGRQQH